MSFFLVDDDMTFHAKAVAAGNEAMGAWVRAGAWCKKHGTDGRIPAEVAHTIAPKAVWQRLASERVRYARVLEGGDYELHDFLEWQSSAAEDEARREAARQQRAEAGRRSGESRRRKSSAPPAASETRTRSERESNETRTSRSTGEATGGERNTNPSPSPSPRARRSDTPPPTGVAPSQVPAESVSRVRALRTFVPEDLVPTQETIDRCLMARRPDPRPLMPDFIAWMRKELRTSGNWQDEIFLWAGKQPAFDRSRAPRGPTQPWQGETYAPLNADDAAEETGS